MKCRCKYTYTIKYTPNPGDFVEFKENEVYEYKYVNSHFTNDLIYKPQDYMKSSHPLIFNTHWVSISNDAFKYHFTDIQSNREDQIHQILQ